MIRVSCYRIKLFSLYEKKQSIRERFRVIKAISFVSSFPVYEKSLRAEHCLELDFVFRIFNYRFYHCSF